MARLETSLNDFDPDVRAAALRELLALAARDDVSLPPAADLVNMHCHTFFSFSGYGQSPTGLAWLGRRRGLRAMGIVDFDVLDGVDEFLDACQAVGLRGSAGIETRVLVPEFAGHEINSPGEPGVCYQMGIGFATGVVAGQAAEILADLRQRAEARNREMFRRIGAYLQPLAVDYEEDVLPLTPKGNATERHLLAAWVAAAEKAFPHRASRARFWAEKLGLEAARVEGLIDDRPALENVVRARLMKLGGVAYVQPGPASFPTMEEFHAMVELSGALPCFAWLDGTSSGEQAIDELLALMIEKGVVAVNIIPDRNWNVADPGEKQVMVQNLYRFVELAQALDLPLNVGTEMNRYGQKFVDDFQVPELAPLRPGFLDGAHFVYGHTVLERALGLGFQSDWARGHLPARRERNAFYTRVGYLVPPGEAGRRRLESVDHTMSPADVLAALEEHP